MNLTSIESIWKFMRKSIRSERSLRRQTVTEPRLHSMDIALGSAPSDDLSEIRPHRGLRWERQASQRFTIDLSDRDDEAKDDVATVLCVQLEALKAKFGREEQVFQNEGQKVLFENVLRRAHEGAWNFKPTDMLMDRELTRPLSFWNTRDPRRFYYR